MHQSCAYFSHGQVPKAKPVASRLVPFFALAARPLSLGCCDDRVDQNETDAVPGSRSAEGAPRSCAAEFVMGMLPGTDASKKKAKRRRKARLQKLMAKSPVPDDGSRVLRGEGDEFYLVKRNFEAENSQKVLLPSTFYFKLDAERQEMILQHFLANESGQSSLVDFASAVTNNYSVPFYLRLGPAKKNFFQRDNKAISEDCDYVQRWLVVIPSPPATEKEKEGAEKEEALRKKMEAVTLDPAVDGPGATLDCTTFEDGLKKTKGKRTEFLSGLSRTSFNKDYVAEYMEHGGAFFVARKKDAGHTNRTLAIADADQVRKCGMAFENCSIDIVPPAGINKTFVADEKAFDQELQDSCPGSRDFEDVETEPVPMGLAVYQEGPYYHPGVMVQFPEATYEFHMGKRGVSVLERPNPSRPAWIHGRHVKDEAIGETTASKSEIWRLVSELSWSAFTRDTYHMLDTNCSHFAQTVLAGLGVKTPFPRWIDRLANGVRKLPGSHHLGNFGTRRLHKAEKAKNNASWRFLESPQPKAAGCEAGCE